MNKNQQWHLDEQKRLANKVIRANNGGQIVDREGIEWGRKRIKIKRTPLSKENLAIEIA